MKQQKLLASLLALIAVAFLAAFTLPMPPASLDVDKTEELYGFRIQSDKPVVEFEKGDSLRATVTDPDKLTETLGFPETVKGDTITMTYLGDKEFAFTGESQGKAFGVRNGISLIIL